MDARPDTLPLKPNTVPEKLRDRDMWICWRYKRDQDRAESTKVPVDADTDGYAS